MTLSRKKFLISSALLGGAVCNLPAASNPIPSFIKGQVKVTDVKPYLYVPQEPGLGLIANEKELEKRKLN